MRKPLLLALAAASVAASACNHVTTKVPGVLDLRSDGTEAPAETSAPAGGRSGFDSWISGAGLQGTSQITIEDRKFWLLRLFTISNESATEEINAAMGPSGGLRSVTIGDTFSGTDLLLSMGIGLCTAPLAGIGGLVVPPFTATVSGTRIKGGVPEPAFEAPSSDSPPADAPVPAPAPGS